MQILTDKKFEILYVDPPWSYGGDGGTKWRPASEFYPVMSFKELEGMSSDIQSIINLNSCLLFMWVVSAELPNCIKVAESWGFNYITVAFVWNKQRANVGNYTMSNCELCLLFKRGKIPSNRVRNPGQQQLLVTLENEQYHSEAITIHSRKPAEFRYRIEKMFPTANKLELFARSVNPGWSSWGYDIDMSGNVVDGPDIKALKNKSIFDFEVNTYDSN